MLAVERWAKDKHPFIAIIAPQMAAFTRDLPEIFRNIKKHQLFDEKAKIPKLAAWSALYRNHRLYCEPYLQMLHDSSELVQHVVSFGETFQGQITQMGDSKTLALTPDDVIDVRHFIQEFKSLSFADLESDFKDRRLDCQTSETVQKFFGQYDMEFKFVFLVYFPCFFLYQTTPSRLYRKARNGDKVAMDKLLRLDPFMLHDPSIGQQLQKIRIFGRQSTYQNLIEAPLKPIKANLTKNKIKTSMATLISMIAEACGQPLTSADIRVLFDAVARDADKHDEDTAIPRSSDTLGKAIQRKRSDWQKLLKPDSKTLK